MVIPFADMTFPNSGILSEKIPSLFCLGDLRTHILTTISIYITKEALAEAAAFAQSNSSLQPTHPRRPKHQCQRATFRGGLGPRTLDSRDIWSIGFIIPGHMQNIQIIFSMVLY